MKYIILSFSLIFLSLFSVPPKTIPPELYEDFTFNHQIPVIEYYVDGTQPLKDLLITLKDGSKASFYSKQLIEQNIKKAQKKQKNYYGMTDTWLYQALEAFPIKNKDVLIIGSVVPWYESIVLAFGGHPTTVEYNKIVTNDKRLTIMTVDEFNQNPKQFDIILSISSLEHDGLGRYGDPLNPYADFQYMVEAKSLLKEGGAMILAVPVGQDCLAWNAHRIYGKLRFPLLIEGWDVVRSFGFEESNFSRNLGDAGHQPIFYLTPKK